MSVVFVDRIRLFDPSDFFRSNWDSEPEDEALKEIDVIELEDIHLTHTLKIGEIWIDWKERIRRLKEAGYVCLDAKVLQAVLDNKNCIPSFWKRRTEGQQTEIYFDGTTIKDMNGLSYSLYISWNHNIHKWNYNCRDRRRNWFSNQPSAVIRI